MTPEDRKAIHRAIREQWGQGLDLFEVRALELISLLNDDVKLTAGRWREIQLNFQQTLKEWMNEDRSRY